MKHAISALLVFLALGTYGMSWAKTYTLCMLPQYAPEQIIDMITPLAGYLSEATGEKIEVVIANDYNQYEKILKTGAVDIGYQNSYVYTLVSDRHEAVAMALSGEGKAQLRGVVIARKDSGLSALTDLRGKKIAIGSYISVQGYLSQKLSFQDAGISMDTYITPVIAVDNKQENVILDVYTGEADAGFIGESAMEEVKKFIDISQLSVITRCAWLPNWAVSLKKSTPSALKNEIQKALLALQASDPVMKALEIDSFRHATDKDFDVIRNISTQGTE